MISQKRARTKKMFTYLMQIFLPLTFLHCLETRKLSSRVLMEKYNF